MGLFSLSSGDVGRFVDHSKSFCTSDREKPMIAFQMFDVYTFLLFPSLFTRVVPLGL